MGIIWTKQELQDLPLSKVFPVARERILQWLLEDYLVGRASFDQNAVNHTPGGYVGISNKQIKMAAAQLTGNADITMDAAWDLFMVHAFGVSRG